MKSQDHLRSRVRALIGGSGRFVSLVGGNAHEPMKGQKYQLVCKVIRQNVQTDEEVDI